MMEIPFYMGQEQSYESEIDIFSFTFFLLIVSSSFNVKADHGKVRIYHADRIQECVHPSLDRGGLVLYALLAGCDYCSVCFHLPLDFIANGTIQEGLPGCGPKLAAAVVSYGHAMGLCGVSPTKLRDLLPTLQNNIADTLRHDKHGLLGRCYPMLATKLPITFPNLPALEAYLYPLTSSFHLDTNLLMVSQLPDVPLLAELCQDLFGWQQESLFTKFRSLVWGGVIVRTLMAHVKTADQQEGQHANMKV
jgi:Holliday junction resolvase YEN1